MFLEYVAGDVPRKPVRCRGCVEGTLRLQDVFRLYTIDAWYGLVALYSNLPISRCTNRHRHSGRRFSAAFMRTVREDCFKTDAQKMSFRHHQPQTHPKTPVQAYRQLDRNRDTTHKYVHLARRLC